MPGSLDAQSSMEQAEEGKGSSMAFFRQRKWQTYHSAVQEAAWQKTINRLSNAA